ncbi:MAG: Rnf-Nqr domain containing protein [bacterium]|jgi:Na+-transporting NADH:ubiquinone oxidoreductase subunit D|nr:Rnf-Nqr domain containing protein [bacterium]|tara:strand:- start:204 stop:830 length:627 start_codon:yes stop_codon:yes gene_type:complete
MRLTKLFYTRWFRTFSKGLLKENAVCCQLLGLCSALAVSNKVENALAMGMGVLFVLVLSSFFVSLLRKHIPSQYRIITYMIIISTLVIVVDQYLKAFFPQVSKQLGPYVALIITNCIIMGRHEAFAVKNPVGYSVIDAIGNSFSYCYTLIIIAAVREILAFGTFFNISVTPPGFPKWVVMAMAPGAFFLLALFIWIFKIGMKLHPESE